MTTRYIVQSFQQKGRALVASPMRTARSSDAAITLAERMSEARDGVVAFSQEIDVETDCYDEPIVLYRNGTLPAELME